MTSPFTTRVQWRARDLEVSSAVGFGSAFSLASLCNPSTCCSPLTVLQTQLSPETALTQARVALPPPLLTSLHTGTGRQLFDVRSRVVDEALSPAVRGMDLVLCEETSFSKGKALLSVQRPFPASSCRTRGVPDRVGLPDTIWSSWYGRKCG